MAGGEIGEGGDSQVINPLCELYSKNWDWTRREIPSVFDPAVQIQTKKQSLNVSLTFEPTKSLKGQAGLEEAAAPISENGPVNAWNAQWHYAGTMHVKWLYDNRILNLSQDLQAKTELLNTCIKKATIEYSNQKVDTDKRLRAEKEELVKISKERVELMERIEVLKTSVKEMKRRESDLQRHAEVEEKDFERFKESVFERAGSREEQIEEINNEIATLTETIEDLQEEKIAEMFSGNFGNRADVEKSTKAAAERKMKEKEIERLEASLARHRNDDEALRMEMNGTTEKIRAVKGKSVGQMFTFTSLSTSVKRLRKSAQSAEAKLKTTRDTARPLKRRLKELIEKDSLSPILLETIMVELVREKNGLNIVLDNLNSRKDELSDMTMELQRVKTRHGLENSKTFTQRMQREAAALEKETLHVQDEENKSFERILKLAKKEQALKDSLKREALEIQKLKNEIEESERKIKLTQTDIIAPKRIRSGGQCNGAGLAIIHGARRHCVRNVLENTPCAGEVRSVRSHVPSTPGTARRGDGEAEARTRLRRGPHRDVQEALGGGGSGDFDEEEKGAGQVHDARGGPRLADEAARGQKRGDKARSDQDKDEEAGYPDVGKRLRGKGGPSGAVTRAAWDVAKAVRRVTCTTAKEAREGEQQAEQRNPDADGERPGVSKRDHRADYSARRVSREGR